MSFFITGLTRELATMRALCECLQNEQKNLVRADTSVLDENASEKNTLILQLADMAKERMSAIVADGFPADEVGMRAWLVKQDAGTSGTWQELLAQTAAAKEINRTNGILIHQHLMRVKNSLQILQGNTQPVVYGSNGKPGQSGTKRSLVSG